MGSRSPRQWTSKRRRFFHWRRANCRDSSSLLGCASTSAPCASRTLVSVMSISTVAAFLLLSAIPVQAEGTAAIVGNTVIDGRQVQAEFRQAYGNREFSDADKQRLMRAAL